MVRDRRAAGHRSYRTAVVASVSVAVAASVGLAGCGTTDEASRMTLPPLETTTTTTTTTTTIPQERFYEVQPGDSLSAIAGSRGIAVVDILNANPALENEDSIRAGDVIQIPLPGESDPAGGAPVEPATSEAADTEDAVSES